MAVFRQTVWKAVVAADVSKIVTLGFTTIDPFKEAAEQPPEVVTT